MRICVAMPHALRRSPRRSPTAQGRYLRDRLPAPSAMAAAPDSERGQGVGRADEAAAAVQSLARPLASRTGWGVRSAKPRQYTAHCSRGVSVVGFEFANPEDSPFGPFSDVIRIRIRGSAPNS